MSDKSILFNEEAIRAILDDHKAQVRQVRTNVKCQVGDILYVKEDWKIKNWYQDDGELDIEYLADGEIKHIDDLWKHDETGDIFAEYWMECSEDYIEAGIKFDEDRERFETPAYNPCRVRPAEEMPEYFSRLRIKITAVREEKLQDITGREAVKANPYVWVYDFEKV